MEPTPRHRRRLSPIALATVLTLASGPPVPVPWFAPPAVEAGHCPPPACAAPPCDAPPCDSCFACDCAGCGLYPEVDPD